MKLHPYPIGNSPETSRSTEAFSHQVDCLMPSAADRKGVFPSMSKLLFERLSKLEYMKLGPRRTDSKFGAAAIV